MSRAGRRHCSCGARVLVTMFPFNSCLRASPYQFSFPDAALATGDAVSPVKSNELFVCFFYTQSFETGSCRTKHPSSNCQATRQRFSVDGTTSWQRRDRSSDFRRSKRATTRSFTNVDPDRPCSRPCPSRRLLVRAPSVRARSYDHGHAGYCTSRRSRGSLCPSVNSTCRRCEELK